MVGNTLGRVAGLAAFALMVARLGRLFEAGGEAPAWHLILVASAFLGGVVWWLLSQVARARRVAAWIFAVAGLLLFLRVAVPQSLVVGFLPGPEAPGALAREMAETWDIMRYASSPVFPSSGLVAVLAVVFWILGAVFLWGATEGPVAAMSVPSIGLYLQFAVIDRVPGGRGWMAAAAATFALAIAAVAHDRTTNAGRVRDAGGRPLPRHGGRLALAMATLVAISSFALVGSASGVIDETGNIDWRSGAGYGPGSGGIRFDRSVDLQRRLISRTNAELFRATVDENAPPPERIYWRLETLALFNGESFLPGTIELARFTPGTAGGDPQHRYRGTTTTFTQRIRIEQLRGPLAPTAGIAEVLQSDTEDVNQFQVTGDGTLVLQSQIESGMSYQVAVSYPLDKSDFAALATGDDGRLTPLFAEAVEAGALDMAPVLLEDRDLERPDDIDRYLALPDDFPSELATLAREQTLGARTDFERATLLEHWFRDSGTFTYSLEITPGHSDLLLTEWLLDEENPDYRTGYCEQFAASMAVLGRALNIPTRVVMGFTPGEVLTQSDGSQAIVVRDRNAHAWVEMWMDGFGWVKFDPTPRSDGATPPSFTVGFDPSQYVAEPLEQPRTIDQPGFDEPGSVFGLDDVDLGVSDGSDEGSTWLLWLLGFALIALAVSVVPVAKRVRRRRRLKSLRRGDVTAAWDEIVDQLRDLGHEIPEHQTPIEFAQATDRSLVPVARAYGAAIYGGRSGMGTEDDLYAVETWMRLRYESGRRVRARLNPGSLLRR